MKRRYRHVHLAAWARWPRGRQGRRLTRKLNRVGRDIDLVVIVVSGQRGWRQQHAAYMDYLRGGTLAAPCCSKRYQHTAAECLRQCASNHCRGAAADCRVRLASGVEVSIGEHKGARRAMRKHGLCLPVGQGEVWHVEIGRQWLS